MVQLLHPTGSREGSVCKHLDLSGILNWLNEARQELNVQETSKPKSHGHETREDEGVAGRKGRRVRFRRSEGLIIRWYAPVLVEDPTSWGEA